MVITPLLFKSGNVEKNDNSDDSDAVLMVVLLLVGISLICFGLVIAAKKKKK